MPYKLVQRHKHEWLVVNADTGDVKGTHPSKEAAQAQMRALYAHAKDTRKALTSHASFLSITKRDDAEHIVEGYASSEDIDLQPGEWEGQGYEGDVVSADAIEQALPEFMEWANLREMHKDDSAIGTILKAEVVRGQVVLPDGRRIINPLHVIAKIVDPGAWEKVVTGVYKGFSIQADVFKLKLTKMAQHVVRLIQSLRLTEISLVDRPANPGAKIVLWKGADMAKKLTEVAKAADPKKAVEMLQECRNACELEGDLECAQNYSNAIALIMQGMGADVEVVAEPDEEADGEHEEMGKEPPEEGGEGDADALDAEEPTEAETEKALDDLQHEEEEKPAQTEAEGVAEQKKDAGEMEKEDETKKSAQPDPTAKTVVQKAVTSPRAVDTITKAEFASLSERVDTLRSAYANDLPRIVKALEDLAERVDALQIRPVLRELPLGALSPDATSSVEIMKSLRDEVEDPTAKELLSHKIAEMEIRAAEPRFVGFSR